MNTPSLNFANVNARCIRIACERLAIPYRIHDDYGNVLSVGGEHRHFFASFSTPFNNGSVNRLCADKEFSWRIFKDVVSTPRTRGYFDPYPLAEEHAVYVAERDYDSIARAICKEFSLPAIVKMNRGSQGKNVFLCHSKEEVLAALTCIFDHASYSYDYLAIAQEYIPRHKEYRVVVFERDVVLAYEKDFSEGTFIGNLSPLHYENARARPVEDLSILEHMQTFISPIFNVLDVEFAGLDIVLDENGHYHLLELNTQPGFSYFVRDNGDDKLVSMYSHILQRLLTKERARK